MAGNGDDKDDDKTGTDSGLTPAGPGPIQSTGDEGFEIIEVDNDGREISPRAAAPAPARGGREDEDEEDRRLSEEEGGEQPLIRQGAEGGDSQRPRETRSTRNARRREARQRDSQETAILRAEMDDMRRQLTEFQSGTSTRLTELGERNIQNEIARLDGAVAEAETAYKAANSRIVAAMQSADHEAHMEALEARDTALVRKTQLGNEKRQVEKMLSDAKAGQQVRGGEDRGTGGDQRQHGGDPQRQRQQPAAMPARVKALADAFTNEHDWYNPKAGYDDLDSHTVLLLDRAVANDGFDPGTPAYWNELEDRMRERLPHRFQEGGANQQRREERQDARGGQQQPRQAPPRTERRGPPAGSPGDRGPAPSNRPQLKISPARKQAMIDSGSIGTDGRVLDSAKYKRQLSGFAEFDRTNGS